MGVDAGTGVTILATRPEDVMELSPLIRTADRREAAAYGMRSAEEGILRGLQISDLCWTAWADGDIVCIFGVAPGSILLQTGIPWLIGSVYLEKHGREFACYSKPFVAQMLQLYPRLSNFVDARNAKAIRWLKWLGFRLEGPSPFGPDALPFYRFTLEV